MFYKIINKKNIKCNIKIIKKLYSTKLHIICIQYVYIYNIYTYMYDKIYILSKKLKVL